MIPKTQGLGHFLEWSPLLNPTFGLTSAEFLFAPAVSMGQVYVSTSMVDFYGINVGKYTSGAWKQTNITRKHIFRIHGTNNVTCTVDLHHLECKKTVNHGNELPTSTGEFIPDFEQTINNKIHGDPMRTKHKVNQKTMASDAMVQTPHPHQIHGESSASLVLKSEWVPACKQ